MIHYGKKGQKNTKMSKKSIAQNHLSSLALKGRFGDTELAHVNPQEKSMLKSMGGSGGINPKTGLREYTPATGFMATAGAALPWIGLGLSVIQGIQAAKKEREEGQRQLNMLNQQSAALDRSSKALVKGKEAKEESVATDYVSGTTALGTKEGTAERGMKKALESTGLVKSSGVSEMEFQTEQEFDIGKKDLYTQLDKSMGEVSGWFAGEQGKLGAERRSIEAQKKQAKAMTESYWMGIV